MSRNETWSALCADWRANRGNPKGRAILVLFRLTHPLASRRRTCPAVWWLGLPLIVSYRVLVEWFLSVELPATTRVGAGLKLFHGQGLTISSATVIGKDCTLRQNTTLGCCDLPDGGVGPSPVLGDHVNVGANVVILGPVTIGNESIIGAGAVVVKDVPAGAVVAGNPARILRLRYPVSPTAAGC